MNRLLDLHTLAYLCAVERNRTFSGAAREIGISQPALSKAMERLESSLGVSLFERSKSRISLNDTGEYAAKLAQRLLDDSVAFTERVREFADNASDVRIAACAPWPLMDISPQLLRFFPGRTISTTIAKDESKLIEGLLNGGHHIAITRSPIDHPDVECRRYADERLTLSVNPTHRLADRASISFADLAGETVLGWGGNSFWESVVKENCPATVLFQDSIASLDKLVKGTEFPTFSSDRFAEMGYKERDRLDIPLEDDVARVEYFASCRRCDIEEHAPLLEAMTR